MREGLSVRQLDTRMLGRRIAGKRTEKGLSQTALGTLADLTQNAISSAECGRHKSFPLNVLVSIAEALGVSLDYLVFGEQGPPWLADDTPRKGRGE